MDEIIDFSVAEACNGIAKHWNFVFYKTAPADTYAAFEKLSQQGVETVNDVEWRKIIGMRNALVHEYLNIELIKDGKPRPCWRTLKGLT